MQGFNYTLSWANDFTEVDNAPGEFSNRSARTKANVTLDPKMIAMRDSKDSDYYFKPDTVKVIIKADKPNSWVVKDLKSDKLLKHEQLHYNIAALAGRDLERKILALRNKVGQDLVREKEELGKAVQSEIDKINKEYDEGMQGTDHGKKDGEQSKWELHITSLMSKTDDELKGI